MGFNFIIQNSFLVSLIILLPVIHAWGTDGHYTVCKIAQARLSEAAAGVVQELLPEYANNDLASLCSWADHVKFRYHWSSPLHYIDTPDSLCIYQYDRDCKDETGEKDRCVSGAIYNYTDQLLGHGSHFQAQYNLTEALLFLSHFMGDIHQPLHVGFTSDKGGNTIDVHWYTRKAVLHHVWDDSIIQTAQERFYRSNVDDMIDAINHNITGDWAGLVQTWETCSNNKAVCPDIFEALYKQRYKKVLNYPSFRVDELEELNMSRGTRKFKALYEQRYASEGIKADCDWAYKDVTENSVLEDDYFLSRLPVVNLRLAEGGVRLAATLNRIFR